MGSIIFPPKALPDSLANAAGYKAGLAMSIEEMCDHLVGTSFPDSIRDAETAGIRLRSEEYEDLYYHLLHRIGYTKELYRGPSAELARHFAKSGKRHNLEGVDFFLQISSTMTHLMIRGVNGVKSGSRNPAEILAEIKRLFGDPGYRIAAEILEIINNGMRMNPHLAIGEVWQSVIELNGLFKGTTQNPEKGRFIDQRYIDYLSNNHDRLGEIHWRQFEKLTAEFYDREGYAVDLGPGSGDDGVDIRVWNPDSSIDDSPLFIVQCKRQKDKVEKVVIKGLHADVKFEQAEYGVIVTTSELSRGAKTTISARGYAIEAVERDGVRNWLEKLRTPGTGIVR